MRGNLTGFFLGLHPIGPRRRKRMKFSKLSQLFLVSVLGLSVAALFSACDIVTVDYVYVASAVVASSSNGQIDIYAVDSGSGALRTDVDPVSSGGVDPVSMAVTTDYKNLYVANKGSNSIVHFVIGLDGGLTKADSTTLATAPVAIAVNAAGTYLYAVSGSASASLTAFPLTSGTIGSAGTPIPLTVPGYPTDTIIPTAVNVLSDNYAVYVTAYDQTAYNPAGGATSTANPGWIFGFSVGSAGALTASTDSPWQAGIKPSAVTSDPTDHYVYVTDYVSSQLIAYTVLDLGSDNKLRFLPSGPFSTGNEPIAIVIDPRGRFMYVANEQDNTLSAYTIDLGTGTPSVIVNTTGSQFNSTDSQPVALMVDPALGRYVYTANYLGNSITGFILDTTSGSLKNTQAQPYPISGSRPTAIIGIPHGNHATQSVD